MADYIELFVKQGLKHISEMQSALTELRLELSNKSLRVESLENACAKFEKDYEKLRNWMNAARPTLERLEQERADRASDKRSVTVEVAKWFAVLVLGGAAALALEWIKR